MKAGIKYKSVDEYISSLSPTVKKVIIELRRTIKKAAPKAEELISYNMPAFKFHGMLVYYAANKEHIGFYPTASGVLAFKNELKAYDVSKGTIRFPIGESLPLDLIGKIVQFRVDENLNRTKAKPRRSKSD